MVAPTNGSGIRDNHRRGSVAEFLKAKLQTGSRLSVVSAYFTIYAYEALKDKLDHIEHIDFLFGEPRFISSLDPDKTEKKAFILDGNGLQLANKLQQKRVARECADWIRQKVAVRRKSVARAEISLTSGETNSHHHTSGAFVNCSRSLSAPDEKYELRALPDRKFSGLHLMCLMYAGFKRVVPEHEVQMDLNNPFLTALQMHKNGDHQS
jgi:formylmethanofuran dehydrogenase subunit A